MEKIYYPSPRKVLLQKYLYPIASGITGLSIAVLYIYFREKFLDTDSWASIVGPIFAFFLFLLIRAFDEGLTGKHLFIKITSTSVSGKLHTGRDMPIKWSQIDFEKSRKKKRFCSIYGDELKFEENLFKPEDVKEIWETIKKHENHKKRK